VREVTGTGLLWKPRSPTSIRKPVFDLLHSRQQPGFEDPEEVVEEIAHFSPSIPRIVVAFFNSSIPCFVTQVPVRSRRRITGMAPSFRPGSKRGFFG
jgi:hypothetical protein